MELKPDDASAYYNMGHAYTDISKYDEAIECYIIISPDDADPYTSMGIAYAKKGEDDLAIECFQKAIQKKNNYAEMTYSSFPPQLLP